MHFQHVNIDTRIQACINNLDSCITPLSGKKEDNMKTLYFKGVKLHPEVAEKVTTYAQKAYRCSFEQLDAIEQYDCIMSSIDSFNDALDAYYNAHPTPVASGVQEILLSDLIDNLDLEPQDSYYQW